MNKRIVYLIIALLIVAGALFALNAYLDRNLNGDPPTGDTAPLGDVTEPLGPEPVTEDALVVPDQVVEAEIYVEEVHFIDEGPGGYVVIHRMTENGEVGDIIGVSDHLAGGRHANVLVPLTEGGAATVDEVLVAMLHTDDGDQRFDAAFDLPTTKTVAMEDETEAGTTTEMGEEIVMVTFTVLDPEESLEGFEVKL